MGSSALTLVRAPAGTGKTVATASWAATRPPDDVVWVTVTAADLTGAGMWALVVEELHHHGLLVAGPRTGGAAYDRVFLLSLAGQLARRSRPVILMVDCECPLPRSVGAGLHYVLQHGSGGVRLVLLSREEPPMPVWRYRLQGTVSEIHADELAFTREEAGSLLAGQGVALSDPALTDLVRRTDGWAAGLMLAARSLADSPDPDAAVAAMRGDDGAVSDYLLAEVLDAQPGAVRDVLLRTSVADLLRPGLVETLAGRRAPRTITSLLSGNALLEAVPGSPGCYRYQPLFRDLLRARLLAESPATAAQLEHSAAAWMAANGHLEEAVTAAVAQDSWEEAARFLVEDLAVAELLGHPSSSRLVPLVTELPADVPGAPAALVRAAVSVAAGDLATADLELARAEPLVEAGTSPPTRLALELVRLERATCADDVKAALAAAEAADQALVVQDGRLVAAHPEIAALVMRGRGTALATLGDLDAAGKVLAAGIAGSGSPRCAALSADCRGLSALLAAWRGQLTRGAELAESTGAQPSSAVSTPATAAVALAWVAAERYDAGGSTLLATPPPAVLPQHPLARSMLAIARSRAHRARQDFAEALSELDNPWLGHLPGWLREQVRIETAGVHVSAGNLAAAATMLEGLGCPETPEAEVARGRLALASGDLDGALLDPLVTEAPAVALSTRVTALLVQAGALLRGRHDRSATGALTDALRLAAPEMIRRPFEEAPGEVRRLLHNRTGLGRAHRWLTGQTPGAGAAGPAADRPLVEPLTERERQVLALLAELLTTEEIAGTLFVSVNTVRTHVRSILRKLGATRRNDAIRRARALGILPGPPPHDGITRYG